MKVTEEFEEQLKLDGFIVIKDKSITDQLKNLSKIFYEDFYDTGTSPERARKKLSVFANSLDVRKFLILLMEKLDFKTIYPVFSGPCVTHYTSNNDIGKAFGLGWHQDWPSMASSLSSYVVWSTLTPASVNTHGLELIPRSHTSGIFPGKASDHGWIVKSDDIDETAAIVPELPDGGVIIFSSFLLHRTHINDKYIGEKMAFSQRLDNFDDEAWERNNYQSAYKTRVDRDLFEKYK